MLYQRGRLWSKRTSVGLNGLQLTDKKSFAGHNTWALTTSLLITGISQLLTVRGKGPRRRDSLSKLGIINDGALLVRDGLIAAVGTRAQVESLAAAKVAEKLDVGGR